MVKNIKKGSPSSPTTMVWAAMAAAVIMLGGAVVYTANVATRSNTDPFSHAAELAGGSPDFVTCAPGPDVVTFYDSKYYGGGCYANSGVGQYANPGNINADSIKVGKNVQITIYNAPNFQYINPSTPPFTVYSDVLHLQAPPFNRVGDNGIKSYIITAKQPYTGSVIYPSTDGYYPYARCLSALGFLDSSFSSASGTQATRSQLAKLAVLAADYQDSEPTQHFLDVPPSDANFIYIERARSHNVISGYSCRAKHGPGEGCHDSVPAPNPPNPNDLDYFEPNGNLTRGQMAKILTVAYGLDYSPMPVDPNYTFGDVTRQNGYWSPVEVMNGQQIISGYACGGVHGACDSQNRRVFDVNGNVTQGQALKILVNTWFPATYQNGVGITGCANWPGGPSFNQQGTNQPTG